MSDDKWLDELKVGDKVVIKEFGLGYRFLLKKVTNITEKKRDISVDDIKFRSNGSEYGSRDRSFSRTFRTLLPANRENLELVKKYREEVNFERVLGMVADMKSKFSHDTKVKLLKSIIEIIAESPSSEEDEA